MRFFYGKFNNHGVAELSVALFFSKNKRTTALQDFKRQTGFGGYPDFENEAVFDEPMSQKAVWADKKVEKEAEKIYNFGSREKNLKAYLSDEKIRAYIRSDTVKRERTYCRH